MPNPDSSGTDHGEQLKQFVCVLGTFLSLVETHHDNPAFMGKFLPIARSELAAINAIADELLHANNNVRCVQ